LIHAKISQMNLSPALAGALIDKNVQAQEITATIIDLVLRGYWQFREIYRDGKLADYELTLLRDPGSAAAHERELIKAFLGSRRPGESRLASEATGHRPIAWLGGFKSLDEATARIFVTRQEAIKDQIFSQLTGQGYFARNPRQILKLVLLFGSFASVLSSLPLLWLSFPPPFLTAVGWLFFFLLVHNIDWRRLSQPRTNQQLVRLYIFLMIVAVCLPLTLWGFVLTLAYIFSPGNWFVGILGGVYLSGLFIISIANALVGKTKLGEITSRQLQDYRQALSTGTAKPDNFSSDLPYAVAFGVEDLYLQRHPGQIVSPLTGQPATAEQLLAQINLLNNLLDVSSTN